MMEKNTVTVQEMKEIEKNADMAGLSYYQMMENAGAGSYKEILSRYPSTDTLLIFCGKGNNGGDGLVVARLAALDGKRVIVVLVEGNPVTTDAAANFNKLPNSVEILSIVDFAQSNKGNISSDAVVVDALYGTGFHGELRESGRMACKIMNSLSVPVVALDIPSGCGADDGSSCEDAVMADATVVFHAYKNVHNPAIVNCGSCTLVSIGIVPN